MLIADNETFNIVPACMDNIYPVRAVCAWSQVTRKTLIMLKTKYILIYIFDAINLIFLFFLLSFFKILQINITFFFVFFHSCVFYYQFRFKETTKACLMFPLVREMAIASQLPTTFDRYSTASSVWKWKRKLFYSSSYVIFSPEAPQTTNFLTTITKVIIWISTRRLYIYIYDCLLLLTLSYNDPCLWDTRSLFLTFNVSQNYI